MCTGDKIWISIWSGLFNEQVVSMKQYLNV